MRRFRRSGFTLIELLVVIAINEKSTLIAEIKPGKNEGVNFEVKEAVKKK